MINTNSFQVAYSAVPNFGDGSEEPVRIDIDGAIIACCGDDKIKVGKVLASRLDAPKENSFGDLFDDAQEVFEICSVLFDTETGKCKPQVKKLFGERTFNGVLLIHHLRLDPNCRGRNWGLAVMQDVIRTFGRGCGLVGILPFPLQYRDREDEMIQKDGFKTSLPDSLKKLREYYSLIGFKQIGDSNVFALSLRDFNRSH